MTKREVGKVLRAALAAMNDKGRHWTQNYLEEVREGELRFCAVGAINHVTGRANMTVPGTSAYGVDDKNREAVYALANQIRLRERMEPLELDDSLHDGIAVETIWNYNDVQGRTWDEIVEMFEAAAAKPVLPRGKN